MGIDYNLSAAKKLAGFGHLPNTTLSHEPVQLVPVVIDKPWGEEIWYTAIEARGESGVHTAAGELPLSQYLAQAPTERSDNQPVVLLKILAPKATENTGDLYFEVHEEKREVYVVTRIDPDAWPSGIGGIRFGMNQRLRESYGDDKRFRKDYLAAVCAYERIRRVLDGEINDTLPTLDEEQTARAAMYAFTQMQPLAVGDVVRVPPNLPHSLQHGVRVVEFQTPTYERQIISFGQQVVTQPHWDSATAIAKMRLDAPPVCDSDAGERIVEFDHFNARRVTLDANQHFRLNSHIPYAICICVAGQLCIGDVILNSEDAAFVPKAALPINIRNLTDAPSLCLLAAPQL